MHVETWKNSSKKKFECLPQQKTQEPVKSDSRRTTRDKHCVRHFISSNTKLIQSQPHLKGLLTLSLKLFLKEAPSAPHHKIDSGLGNM